VLALTSWQTDARVQAATECEAGDTLAHHTLKLPYSNGHFADDQAIWVGTKDRRKTSRKERAGATIYQDTSVLGFDERNYQVCGFRSELFFVLRPLSSFLIPIVTVRRLIEFTTSSNWSSEDDCHLRHLRVFIWIGSFA
jgi:hypothetical protein